MTIEDDSFVVKLTQAQSRLWAYIQSLTGHAGWTHDILQETNLRLWQIRDQYDSCRPFVSWAYAVAYNQVRTARRKTQRERLVFREEATLEAIARAHETWQQDTDGRLKAMDVCLEEMGPEQKDLVHQHYHVGTSIDDLAASRGKRPNTIAVALHRIRQALAECIRRRIA